VLAVRVVVAVLRPPEFVAVTEHGYAERQKQRCHEVATLARADREDGLVVGLALYAAVPRSVVVRAVAVVLEVREVVLLVVGHQIGEREAVMRGDEVDARHRSPAVGQVEIGRAAQPGGELAERLWRATPKVAGRIAVLAVPLRPQWWEAADLIAARPDVPRL